MLIELTEKGKEYQAILKRHYPEERYEVAVGIFASMLASFERAGRILLDQGALHETDDGLQLHPVVDLLADETKSLFEMALEFELDRAPIPVPDWPGFEGDLSPELD